MSSRHTCYKCGRVRNLEHFVRVEIPISLQGFFDRKYIFLCKNFGKGWYNNYRKAETDSTCLEKISKDIISLEQNVVSGLTQLAWEIDQQNAKYKPYRNKPFSQE
ncbi:hypothetical protein HZQ12_10325 [Elizabethkingia anophelis]|uniref:hypothetical protein n=1 Tax=Elizabethkingia anophelis TaxID=1117645 RepID=UPI0021A2B82D|nr:hypothetical protein [Elizabethkingia anophelis]MCT3977298.1 hypothetical protein [Elizabethkingia anophelis]MCT4040824.1 hypothetical protein [Elizabethkingia anophelis]